MVTKLLKIISYGLLKKLKKMSEEEVILTNCLINFKIELNKHQQVYDEWIIIIALLWLHYEWIENSLLML